MKVLKYYLSLAVILFITASCTKHDMTFTGQIKFDPATQSAFQLHYFVPILTADSNYIKMVKLNDEIIYRTNIATFNAAPSGAVGKFFYAPKGKSNIKLYFRKESAPDYTLVYDKDVTLDAGVYYNIFVHDFNKESVIINNDYPYTKDPIHQDSCGYVKFYNFMYDTVNVPTTLKLQYKRQDHFTGQWVNVGPPVAFGECTGWQPVIVKRPAGVIPGNIRVDYMIDVIDAAGNSSTLRRMNASGAYADYTDYWSCQIGRHYHHIFSGYRTDKTIRAEVRLFTAW
ncbi:MAG: hypothetical protein LBT27_02070 [Prevotellaceae bacterium]|jgi:hypothetical protein|nr:hypothetical protein [Prevotellaceae bacterium]